MYIYTYNTLTQSHLAAYQSYQTARVLYPWLSGDLIVCVIDFVSVLQVYTVKLHSRSKYIASQ